MMPIKVKHPKECGKKTLSEAECVICGSKDVVFLVGGKPKAILNKTDFTRLIEEHYSKGDYLCEECLFK